MAEANTPTQKPADDSATARTKMNLLNDVTINGEKYLKGQGVSVLKIHADEVARLDQEHSKYLATLHEKREYSAPAGQVSVGGGS